MHIAHRNPITGQEESVKEHSENTAELARDFCTIPALSGIAYVAGLLHDLGMYQASFQRRIQGKNIQVDHSGCGALEALRKWPDAAGTMAAYCIAGHHAGLPDGGLPGDNPEKGTLLGRFQKKYEDYNEYKGELKLPDDIGGEKLKEALMDGITKDDIGMMVDKYAFFTRFVYSCLVDAESIDSARAEGMEVPDFPEADFQSALLRVNAAISSSPCSTALQEAVRKTQGQILKNITQDVDVYLLGLPPVSLRPLIGLRAALERLMKGDKKRVIYVTPQDAMADPVAASFQDTLGDSAQVLQHQVTFPAGDIGENDGNAAAKAAAETWDAKTVIVTTADQFLKTLHGARRRDLRRLHNLADSVIVLDEACRMQENHLLPCLRSISFLTEYAGSEVIFLTSILPDLGALFHKYALPQTRVVDLVPGHILSPADSQVRSYKTLKSVNVQELVSMAESYPSSVIIANSKEDALDIFRGCHGKKWCLTTYLPPVERRRQMREIQKELERLHIDYPDMENVPEERCIRIVSTSILEGFAWLDVQAVFRELSGLASVLQSGNICNREGRFKDSPVYVYSLRGKEQPLSVNAGIAKDILGTYGNPASLEIVKEYYRRLNISCDRQNCAQSISSGVIRFDGIPFRSYAKDMFRDDQEDAIPVIIPLDRESEGYVRRLREEGLFPGAERKLQDYVCCVCEEEFRKLVQAKAVDDFGTGIWCLVDRAYYDLAVGILVPVLDGEVAGAA